MRNFSLETYDHEKDSGRFRYSLTVTFLLLLLLWFVKLSEIGLDLDFSGYGIYPRSLHGSVGILFSPFIHGDLSHLLSNTFPLLILMIGLFYFYKSIAFRVLFMIYAFSGIWVWIFARPAYHIGISGIIYGLMFFLLMIGALKRERKQMAISFIVMVLYGGSMFTGIFPGADGVSWEAHLTGAVAGIILAVVYRSSPHFSPIIPPSPENVLPKTPEDDIPWKSTTHTGAEDIHIKIDFISDLKDRKRDI